jgi:hypothetical protein
MQQLCDDRIVNVSENILNVAERFQSEHVSFFFVAINVRPNVTFIVWRIENRGSFVGFSWNVSITL